ncbi:peroxin-3 [Cystoisospora suis]|uniref:Peroxin-3 n=1 Tax=Cystoisospora suis TaxID=483139 RepID=A0A2C6K1C2_9APIC|nr:peroxin-3 [Cystoisospora suis]
MFLRRTWNVVKRHRWKLLVGGGAAAAAAGVAYLGNLVYVHYKYLSEIVNDTDELDRLLAELLGVNPEDIKEAVQKEEEEEKRKHGVLVEEADLSKKGKNGKEKREEREGGGGEEEEASHDHGGSLTSRVTSFFSSFFGNERKEEKDKKGSSKTRNMIGSQEEGDRGEIDDILKRISQSIEWKRTLQFLKVQEVCDKTIWSVRTPLHHVICDSFFVDQYTAILRDPASVRKLSPARKRRCFFEMSIEVFARTLTSLYLFILLAVIHRIEVNLIVGHQLREEDESHGRRQKGCPSCEGEEEEEEERRRRTRRSSRDENKDNEKISESTRRDSFKNEVHHSTRSPSSPSSSSIYCREARWKASPGSSDQETSSLLRHGGSSPRVADLSPSSSFSSCKEIGEKANYLFLTSCRYLLRSANSLVTVVDTFLEVTEDYLSAIQPEEVVSSHQLFHLLLEVIFKAHALILHRAERRAAQDHLTKRNHGRKHARQRKQEEKTRAQVLRDGEVKSERSERGAKEEEREDDREKGDFIPQGLAALLLPMDESILDIRRVKFQTRYEEEIGAGGGEDEEEKEEDMAGGRFLSKRYRRKSIWERTMKEIEEELSSLTGAITSPQGIRAYEPGRSPPSSSSLISTDFSANTRHQSHSEKEEEGPSVSLRSAEEQEKERCETSCDSQSTPSMNTRPLTCPPLQSSPSMGDAEEEEEGQNSSCSSSTFRRHLLRLLLNETQDILESPIASSAVHEALTGGVWVLVERLQFSLLQNGVATLSPPPPQSSSSSGVSTSSSTYALQSVKVSPSSSTDRGAVASSDFPRSRQDDPPTSPFSDKLQTRSIRGIEREELPREKSTGTSQPPSHVLDSSPSPLQKNYGVEEKSLSHICFFPFARCFGRFCQLGDWIVLGDQSGLLLSSAPLSRRCKEEEEDTHKTEEGHEGRERHDDRQQEEEREREEEKEEKRDDVYKDSELMALLSTLPQLEQLSSLLFFPIDSEREAARVEAFLTIAKEEKQRMVSSKGKKSRAILSRVTSSRSCRPVKSKFGEDGKRSDSSHLLSRAGERGEEERGRIGRKEEEKEQDEEEKKRQREGVRKDEEMTERRRDEHDRGLNKEGEEGDKKKKIEEEKKKNDGLDSRRAKMRQEGEGESGRPSKDREEREKKKKEEEEGERRDLRLVKDSIGDGDPSRRRRRKDEKPSSLPSVSRSEKVGKHAFPDKTGDLEEIEKMGKKNTSSFLLSTSASSSSVYVSGGGEESKKENRFFSSTTSTETKVVEEEEGGELREVLSKRSSTIHHESHREVPLHEPADSSVSLSTREREEISKTHRQQEVSSSVEDGSAGFSQRTTNRGEEEENVEKRREGHQLIGGEKPKKEEKEEEEEEEEKDGTVGTMMIVKKKKNSEESLVVKGNASQGHNENKEEKNLAHERGDIKDENREKNTSFLSKMHVAGASQMVRTEEEEEDDDEGFLDCEVSSFSSSSPVSSSTPPDIHSLLLPGSSSRRLSSLDGWADVPAVGDLSNSLATYTSREDDEEEREKETDRREDEKTMKDNNGRDHDRTTKESGGGGGEKDKERQKEEGETNREKGEEEEERKGEKMR